MDELGRLEGEEAAAPGEPAPARIEVAGLSLYTHHGVGEAERQVGQRLVLDIALELEACDAVATDRLEDTVDYGEICQEAALAAQAHSYRTLERLCAAVADRLIGRYAADAVTVRAAKPKPPIPLALDEVAVEVTRERR